MTIIESLKSAERIIIVCHIRPDGDCLGAGFALKRIAERLGKIPDDGDRFTYENWEFTVSETVNHRAAKITVKRLPAPDPEEENEKDREKKNFLLNI